MEAIMNGKTEASKCAMFLYLIGEEGREIFENMTLADADKDKIDPLFTKFREYCNPRKNIT